MTLNFSQGHLPSREVFRLNLFLLFQCLFLFNSSLWKNIWPCWAQIQIQSKWWSNTFSRLGALELKTIPIIMFGQELSLHYIGVYTVSVCFGQTQLFHYWWEQSMSSSRCPHMHTPTDPQTQHIQTLSHTHPLICSHAHTLTHLHAHTLTCSQAHRLTHSHAHMLTR